MKYMIPLVLLSLTALKAVEPELTREETLQAELTRLEELRDTASSVNLYHGYSAFIHDLEKELYPEYYQARDRFMTGLYFGTMATLAFIGLKQ